MEGGRDHVREGDTEARLCKNPIRIGNRSIKGVAVVEAARMSHEKRFANGKVNGV